MQPLKCTELEGGDSIRIILIEWNYLEPLHRNANSEEDTDSQTDVTATLGYRVDDGEDMVIPAESNWDNKEVTEEEN